MKQGLLFVASVLILAGLCFIPSTGALAAPGPQTIAERQLERIDALAAAGAAAADRGPGPSSAMGSVDPAPLAEPPAQIEGTSVLNAIDRGWYNNAGYHSPLNTNYIVGDNEEGATVYRNWFAFDLSTTSPPVIAATLLAYMPNNGYFSIDPSETWEIYDVTTPLGVLMGGGGGVAAYDDLGSGTSYGSVVVTSASNGTWVVVTLNANGLAALNAARGGSIAFGGAITTLDGNPNTNEALFAFSSGAPIAQLSLTTADYDVGVTKTESVDPVVAPGQVTYVVTAWNDGLRDVTGVVIQDALTMPPGVTIDSATPSQGTWTAPNWSVGRLAAGVSATLTIVLNVGAEAHCGTNVIVNTATLTAVAEGDQYPANDTAGQVTLVNTVADLQIEKAALAASATVGEALTYAITVTNAGPGCATDVDLLDLVPAGTHVVSMVADNPYSGDEFCSLSGACDLGMLPYGVAVTVDLALAVDPSYAGDTVVNAAQVAGDQADPDETNNVATVTTTVLFESELSIAKTALAGELAAGGEAGLFSIVVTNDGPSDAHDVTVHEVPDAGLELLALEPGPALPMTCDAAFCTLPVLPAGQTAEIYAQVQAPAGTAAGTYTNTACLRGDAPGQPGLVFSGAPGTGAPPASLGPYLMTRFSLDPRPSGSGQWVSDVPGPTGTLLFDRSMNHRRVPTNWPYWGNGYAGDVYWTGNGSTSLLITLPPDTGAFYFYVRPNGPDAVTFEARAQDGTTSGPISIVGLPGARYFGFYSLGGAPLSTITISAPYAWGYAIGEFGIADHLVDAECTGAPIEVAARADLAVDKTGPLTATVGDLLTYAVAVHNNGPSDAQNVVVIDTLPYGVLSVPGYPLTLNLGTIEAGETITAQVMGRSDANACYEGKVNNTVEVTAGTPDPDPTNNTGAWGTVILGQADLQIEKEALAASVTAGEALTYTITITNAGPGCATGVEVLDLAPPGTHVVSMSADNPYAEGEFCSLNGTCALGTLPLAEDLTLELADHTPGQASGPVYFERMVTVNSTDLPPETHIVDVDITIDFEKIGGWSCATGHDPSYLPYNDEIVFYLTSPSGTRVVLVESLTNWGGSGLGPTYTDNNTYGGPVSVTFDDAAATGVGVNPAYPATGTFEPEQPLSALNGQSPVGTWRLLVGDVMRYDGDPPAVLCYSGYTLKLTTDATTSSQATIELVLGVDSDYAGDTLVNQVQVSAAEADPNQTNNADAATTAVQTEADLSIDKVDLTDPVEPTEGFLYQITVENNGPSDAQNLVVTDTLDADVTFAAVSSGCAYVAADHAVICAVDTLPAGESTYFLLAVNAGDLPSGTILENNVTVDSETYDPYLGNNSDAEDTTVQQEMGPSADLAIQKTATPAVVTGDELITYQITVTNGGPLAATNVQVLEYVPDGATIVSIVPDNPAFGYEFCTRAGVCYLGTVYPTTVAHITTMVRLNNDFAGNEVTNMAAVSGDQVDHVPGNNLAYATVAVANRPFVDLAIDKDAQATVSAGGILTYTLAVFNSGVTDAADVLVTDTLPAGVTFASASPDCVPVDASTVECSAEGLPAGQSLLFTVVVDVDEAIEPGTSLENTAVVAASTYDYHPADNADTADTSVLGMTDLVLDKTGPAALLRGSEIVYTIVVTNYGLSTAQSVDVKDMLPEGVSLVSIAVERSGQAPALCGGLVCQVGDMAPGEVVTITLTGQVDSDIPLHTPLTNVATVFSDTPEGDLSNNTDDHTTIIGPVGIYLPLIAKDYSPVLLPDLVGSFTLTPDQTEYQSDRQVLITAVITNGGTVAAGAFWVDFYLNPNPVPTGPNLAWNDACTLTPCYGLTWEVPAGLAPGASVVLTSTPGSFDVTRSLWSGYLVPGTTDLYLYVDSWNLGSLVGAVLESDEINNRAERHGLIVSGDQRPIPYPLEMPTFPARW